MELLLLDIKSSQLRRFKPFIGMFPAFLHLEVSSAHPTMRKLCGRPRACRGDYKSHLAWEDPGISQEELENVAGERDIWVTLLSLLPLIRVSVHERKWIGGHLSSWPFFFFLEP